MKRKTPILVIASLLALSLSACGNEPDRGGFAKAVKQRALNRGSEAPAMPTAEELKRTIGEALGNTDKRLAIAVVENRNSFTFLTEIASNNNYSTWGSPDRRTLVFKQGVITASRGLGADLMSAKVDETLALVRARRAGTATRSHVYLNGENQETVLSFACNVSAGGNQKLSIGEINTSTQTISERCQGNDYSFENTYQVAPSGRIIQSRQWLGPVNGFFTVQMLR